MRRQTRCWRFLASQAISSRTKARCSGMVIMGALAVLVAPAGWAFEPTWQDNESKYQSAAADSETDKVDDQQAAAECPGLGVVAACCPGKAVRVSECVWGSPADQVGILPGDYILSVNGKELSTPGEFCQMISKLDPGKSVTVKVWREGEELEKQVPLAERADELPESRRAWLGVILSPGEDAGKDGSIMIERVIPGSPAAQAGLRRGDQILKSGDSEVQNIMSFSEAIEERQVGSQLELTVLRDDQEQQISVTLGDLSEASVRQVRQAMRMGNPASMSMSEYQEDSPSITDDAIDDLRNRLRELEQQVRKLSGDASEQDAGERDADKDDNQANLGQEAAEIGTRLSGNSLDVAGQEGAGQEGVVLVVQRGQRPGLNSRDYRRQLDSYRRGRDRAQGYGYGDRDWRSPYGNNWGQRYRSPYYGNQYYRYRGRPYYYDGRGRNQFYGRPGVRFGNFGFYWF